MDGARGQREKMLKLMLVHHHKIGLPFPKQPSSYSVLFVFSNPQAFHHIVFNVESTTLFTESNKPDSCTTYTYSMSYVIISKQKIIL